MFFKKNEDDKKISLMETVIVDKLVECVNNIR